MRALCPKGLVGSTPTEVIESNGVAVPVRISGPSPIGVSWLLSTPLDSITVCGIIARMIAMTNTPFKTTQEVAEILGVTDSRIRQLCREYELGQIVGGTRVLYKSDIKKICETPGLRKIPKKIPKGS